MNNWYVLLAVAVLPLFIGDAFAQQEVNVTSITPCFMNYTTQGIEMWQNCGFDTDYVAAVTMPFEWVTGGMFSMIIVIILIAMTWLKYHTPIYPIAVGVFMIPIALYLFPSEFQSLAYLLMAIGIGALIWYIMIQKTRG